MTDDYKETRDNVIATFADHARALFAADPARRSAMLAVSQYWNDSADDEVHGHVIASTRTTPVWPHECDYNYGDETNDYTAEQKALLAGEECWSCGRGAIDMSFYGGYGDSMVAAFEMFCRENAHQGMDKAEAFIPFAIARRIGDSDDADLELVGRPQRVPSATIGSARPRAEWPDERARMLFDEVCRHATDDAPRAVLSDYLLETHPDDPRGEAIALALAGTLDAEARARRDALFLANAERWMFPLGDVIAPGCAHFERGFLARADVYAATYQERDRVLAAPAWGTVHTIRFAPDSCDVLAPTMVALRDVGPLRDEGVRAIAREGVAWAIETLRVADGDLRALFRTPNLPHLNELELSVAFREEITGAFRTAPWSKHLQRLSFLAWEYGSLADWRSLRALIGVPELAIAISPYWQKHASSWQIGFRADDSVTVRGAGWNGEMTMLRLAELLGELPPDVQISLISTPTRTMTGDDVTWLHEYTGRTITLAA